MASWVTYNPYGTLISDVWRDICVDSDGDLSEMTERFADLFGIQSYTELFVIDCRETLPDIRKPDPGNISEENAEYAVQPPLFGEHLRNNHGHSRLIRGDVLKELSQLPDNSADFAFADPPYNLKKIKLEKFSVAQFILLQPLQCGKQVPAPAKI